MGWGQDVARNRVHGIDATGLVFGSPAHHAGYSTFTGGSNYVQTDINDAPDMTVLIAGRFLDDGTTLRGMMYGNYAVPLAGGGSGGVSIFQAGAGVNSGSARGDGAGGPVTGTALLDGSVSPAGTWALYQHEIPAYGRSRITNLTTGATALAAVAPDPEHKVSVDGKLRIGSGSSSYVGRSDVAFMLVSRQIYSGSDLTALQDWARDLAAMQGIAA
jgi:hypothetical protein